MLTTSTISHNTANGAGGGLFNEGATALYNATIARNQAITDHSGGVANQPSGSVTFRNTIIGDNSTVGEQRADCSGTLTSEGYNLVSDVSSCTIAGNTGADLLNGFPGLDDLTNNGGPTETHSPFVTSNIKSSAVDSGDPRGCVEAQGQALATDQRGAARPQGRACDIGAVEFGVSPSPLPLPRPIPTPAPPNAACFAETGYCISGRIRAYWEQNGGLMVFGYPTGPQQQQTVEGRPFQAQWFERHRLELHPENSAPYDVLLGRLGAQRLEHDGITATPEQPRNQADCLYFDTTGFNVCGRFLQAWRADGLEFDGRPGKSYAESLALFGLPLTGEMQVRLADGQQHTVQWFERARFEQHPENAPPYDVLFGLLGNEIRDIQGIEEVLRGRLPAGTQPSARCIENERALAIARFPNAPEARGVLLRKQYGTWTIVAIAPAFSTADLEQIGTKFDIRAQPFDGLHVGHALDSM